MGDRGTLLYGDEAVRFIEQIADPVTRSLVNIGLRASGEEGPSGAAGLSEM